MAFIWIIWWASLLSKKNDSANSMTMAAFFIFTLPLYFWFIMVSLYYSLIIIKGLFVVLFDYHFYMFPWSMEGFRNGVLSILLGLVGVIISLLVFGFVIYGVLRFLIDGFLLKKMVRDYNITQTLVASE